MAKYKKAPKYEGKDLTLDIGRADKKILDGVEYDDFGMARFAPEFVVEAEEEKATVSVEVEEEEAASASEESEEYTESNLNKCNKGELISLALGEFKLELDMVMKKAEMIAVILKKQGE